MNEPMAVGPGTERDYVTLGRRLLAISLDNAFWVVLYLFFIGGIIAAVGEESPGAAAVILFVYLSLWFNYFSFAEWRWGQTMGKNATGIMVTTVDGDKLSFGQASMRNLLRLVDWLVVGWVMIARGERRQRLGDKVAGTVVVRRPARTGATMQPAPELLARQIAGGAEALAADPPPPPPPAAPPSPPPGRRGRLPDINWGLRQTILGLFGGLLLALIAPVLVLPFDPDIGTDDGSPVSTLVAQGLFGMSLIAVPLGIASGWRPPAFGAALRSLGLVRFSPSGIGWMFLALFAYYVAAALYGAFVITPDQDDIGGELGIGDENMLIAVSAVLLITVLAPISEEIFFRGFIFSGLRSKMSLWPAALVSGLVFGSVHAPTGITTVIPLAALGVALAWLYDKTGSLWPPVIAHVFNNALAVILLT